MGARKRNRANSIKEGKVNNSFALLKNCPSSPRKMRLVADQIRGESVGRALDILKFSPKAASEDIEKLLLSAVANWQSKNEGQRIEESGLYIKEIFVDSAKMLKRIKPAPQGRAHRIRKRSNHVTIVVDSSLETVLENENE